MKTTTEVKKIQAQIKEDICDIEDYIQKIEYYISITEMNQGRRDNIDKLISVIHNRVNNIRLLSQDYNYKKISMIVTLNDGPTKHQIPYIGKDKSLERGVVSFQEEKE